MSTTTIFIELLITGVQAAIWLSLFIFSLFGIEWFSLDKVKGYEAVLGIVLISLAYPLGIFIDNLAERMLTTRRLKIEKRHFPGGPPSVMRTLITINDERFSDSFDYDRTRIRVSRSSALNFGLITIMSVALTLVRFGSILASNKWWVAAVGVVVGTMLTALSIVCWYWVTENYYKRLKQVLIPERIQE